LFTALSLSNQQARSKKCSKIADHYFVALDDEIWLNEAEEWARVSTIAPSRAFSSEVGTGSREENASKQKTRAPFRFHRNGKGSNPMLHPGEPGTEKNRGVLLVSRR
jgi:hypothetical protein